MPVAELRFGEDNSSGGPHVGVEGRLMLLGRLEAHSGIAVGLEATEMRRALSSWGWVRRAACKKR